MSENTPKVTSLDELRAQATDVVELPGWVEGQTLFARLRRVGLMNLVTSGHLPNELLGTVGQLVSAKPGVNPMEGSSAEDVQRYGQLLEAVAKAALVEPTYDQIVEATGGLTDEQLQAIFLYSTRGVRVLELFRRPTRASEAAGVHGEGMGESTE